MFGKSGPMMMMMRWKPFTEPPPCVPTFTASPCIVGPVYAPRSAPELCAMCTMHYAPAQHGAPSPSARITLRLCPCQRSIAGPWLEAIGPVPPKLGNTLPPLSATNQGSLWPTSAPAPWGRACKVDGVGQRGDWGWIPRWEQTDAHSSSAWCRTDDHLGFPEQYSGTKT